MKVHIRCTVPQGIEQRNQKAQRHFRILDHIQRHWAPLKQVRVGVYVHGALLVPRVRQYNPHTQSSREAKKLWPTKSMTFECYFLLSRTVYHVFDKIL